MQSLKKVTVFLSSPSDVTTERKHAERTLTSYKSESSDEYCFEIFDFNKVASEFGDAPQKIINQQLPQFDIYIGIMGNRFGTPTEHFGSGTEEEFKLALEEKKKGKDIHVALLFKSSEAPVSRLKNEVLEQILLVRKFQSEIANEGVYQDFINEDDLTNKIKQIIHRYISSHNAARSAQMYQAEMLTEIPSRDVFSINNDFFSSELNNVGAEFFNGYKSSIQLDDVYVPLDVSPASESSDDNKTRLDDVISTDALIDYAEQKETKLFILGDENSGKSSLCKRFFVNFHKNGFVPVLVKGEDLKSTSLDNINKIIEKAFSHQYRKQSLSRYNQLRKTEKVIIIDDFDDSSLNDKYKSVLLDELCSLYSHIICTTDETYLLGVSVSVPEAAKSLRNFKAYRLRDMGHSLRDQLIQKWVRTGREETISEDEVFASTERYKAIVDNILGSNFVPRKPIIILILLQGIQGGTAGDFAHSSFVRYYKYLIDTTLLSNIPKNKIDLYYAFLPEIAYAIFMRNDRLLSKDDFEQLIGSFCTRMGLHTHDLKDVQSNLIALNVIENKDDRYKFKHSFTYYYFLGQYLSENLSSPDISKQVVDICDRLYLRENANIIIFLSYHTKDRLIIDTVMGVANSIFADIEAFGFSRTSVQTINGLIANSPKVMIALEAKKARERILKRQDQAERQFPDKKESEGIDPADFSTKLSIGFRSMEIIGQLLKNHYAKFEAAPKRALYLSAVNVACRTLNMLMEQLADDVDALVEQITQFDAKIKNETDAKKAIFSIASILTILVVKTTSKYTGADTLSKTYEEILEGQNDLIFKILDFSIKLDTLPVFPIADLRRLVIECECNKLASTTLKNIVKYRLYMCPIESFKERQKICDAVGLSQKPSLLAGFSKTGSA